LHGAKPSAFKLEGKNRGDHGAGKTISYRWLSPVGCPCWDSAKFRRRAADSKRWLLVAGIRTRRRPSPRWPAVIGTTTPFSVRADCSIAFLASFSLQGMEKVKTLRSPDSGSGDLQLLSAACSRAARKPGASGTAGFEEYRLMPSVTNARGTASATSTTAMI